MLSEGRDHCRGRGAKRGARPLTTEDFLRLFVEVRDGYPRGEDRIVGVLRRHRGGRLRCEVVQLDGRHPVVQTTDHLHRDLRLRTTRVTASYRPLITFIVIAVRGQHE